MTTAKNLYALQELDLELERQRVALSSMERRIGDRSALDEIARSLELEKTELPKLQVQQKNQDLEADSLRARLQNVESKLYGGSITSPKEMEGLQSEVNYLKEQLQEADGSLLGTMVELEETQDRVRELEESQSPSEEEWERKQYELISDSDDLRQHIKDLEERREGLTSLVTSRDLAAYEKLRTSKSGEAVVKVERGLCRGCRMSLPTHQLQKVRMGREAVRCGSCGRILLIT